MKDLANRVSKKTGLSKNESDGIVKVVSYEIVQGLIDNGYVIIEGLGTLYRTHSDSKGAIILNPLKEVSDRINQPYTGERSNEIILK